LDIWKKFNFRLNFYYNLLYFKPKTNQEKFSENILGTIEYVDEAGGYDDDEYDDEEGEEDSQIEDDSDEDDEQVYEEEEYEYDENELNNENNYQQDENYSNGLEYEDEGFSNYEYIFTNLSK